MDPMRNIVGCIVAVFAISLSFGAFAAAEDAYLWLDASAAETITTNTSGQVTAWASRSTSGLAATAYTAGGVTAGPSVAVGALAKMNVIDFGSVKSGRDLQIPATSNIRAVFMVAAIDDSEDAFILGGDESFSGTARYHFHRDASYLGHSSNFGYLHDSNSAAALRNGQIRRNRVATAYNTAVGTGYGLITLIPTGGVCASRLCQDRDISGRTGGKRIAELIIFTEPITDAQRDAVEAYLMNKWFIEVPTPTGSLGFDSGKGASKVLGGSALTGMADWDDHLTPAYTRVRGNAADYALGVNYVSTASKVAPYAAVPSGMSDSRSWSVHASMKLAEVTDGVLFGISGATWDNKPYLGVEYCGHDRVRVVYGTTKGAANKKELIAPMAVPDATTAYHSYLLTFDATATSGRYALYIDGVKAGDSGSAARLTGYVVDWAVGNYYGGAEEVGSAVFHEALADDFAIWKDTCLYASQAKGLAGKLPVWAAKYAAAVEGDADFLDLPWSPALPVGTTTFTGSEFVLTNASAAGVTKVTFAEPTAVDKLTVLSAEDCETEFCAFSNLTVPAIDFSRAFGGVGFRVPADWEVTDPLKEYLRNNEIAISFNGTGENGVTFDYGLDNTASTKGHYVFDGGRHAFTYGVGSPDLAFSTTGALENPSLLVKDATTLDYTVKDMNGWCGGLKVTSVVRAETGATLNILQSGQKTVFMNGRLVLEPGSTTTFDINEGAYGLCVYGGVPSDPTLAQIYVPAAEGPANGVAKLTQIGAKPLDIRRSTDGAGGTGGAAITVEADGALEIASPVMGDQPLTKYGAGTVDFLDTITNYTGVLTVAEGTVVLRMTRGLTIGGAGRVHITLTPEEEASKASITIFTPAEGSTVTIGRILDSSGADVTSQYTISGNTIRRKTNGLMLFTK